MTVNEDGKTVITQHEPDTPSLTGEDKRLVDLLTAVLVDPNLHTDTRLRLHREISEILQTLEGSVGSPSRVG